MRLEIWVDNESDALVCASADLRGSGIAPGDPGWDAALAARKVFAVWLEGEDPLRLRLIVDEPLEADEQAQWVGVVRGALSLPQGRLALCGGVAWLLDGERWTEQYARVVDLPAGRYRATLYCYASAPNGRWCAERADAREALGTWFRRTRPGEPMPVWLHNRCVDDPTLDPGQAARWRRAEELPHADVIDGVLHLESLPEVAAWPDQILPEDGVYEPGECRRPQPFPLGLPLAGRALALAEPAAAAKADARLPKWGMQALAQRFPADPPPVAGGPVALPLDRLPLIARIAWCCQPYAHPGLRVVHSKSPPGWRDIEDVELHAEGREWQISLRWNQQPADALAPLTALAAQLRKLADGSRIDLYCARPGHAGAQGSQHWRGVVRSTAWHIDAASPQVQAPTLIEALALVESIEGGRRLRARNEDEALRIEQRVTQALADYFGSNAVVRDGAELVLRRRDSALFERIVARVFWMRYASVWPLLDQDAA